MMLELCCAIVTESVRALWVKRENGKQISKLTGNIQIKWQNNVSVEGRAQGSSGSCLRFEGFDRSIPVVPGWPIRSTGSRLAVALI